MLIPAGLLLREASPSRMPRSRRDKFFIELIRSTNPGIEYKSLPSLRSTIVLGDSGRGFRALESSMRWLWTYLDQDLPDLAYYGSLNEAFATLVESSDRESVGDWLRFINYIQLTYVRIVVSKYAKTTKTSAELGNCIESHELVRSISGLLTFKEVMHLAIYGTLIENYSDIRINSKSFSIESLMELYSTFGIEVKRLP